MIDLNHLPALKRYLYSKAVGRFIIFNKDFTGSIYDGYLLLVEACEKAQPVSHCMAIDLYTPKSWSMILDLIDNEVDRLYEMVYETSKALYEGHIRDSGLVITADSSFRVMSNGLQVMYDRANLK